MQCKEWRTMWTKYDSCKLFDGCWRMIMVQLNFNRTNNVLVYFHATFKKPTLTTYLQSVMKFISTSGYSLFPFEMYVRHFGNCKALFKTKNGQWNQLFLQDTYFIVYQLTLRNAIKYFRTNVKLNFVCRVIIYAKKLCSGAKMSDHIL